MGVKGRRAALPDRAWKGLASGGGGGQNVEEGVAREESEKEVAKVSLGQA